MNVAFYTLGCKVNQYDTQMMSEKFTAAGYEITDFNDFADIYIINTCTVTQISDKKSRNIISRAHRKNPNAVIAVCGCFSQVSPNEAAAIDGVDIVIGTRNRADILYYVNKFLKTGRQIIDTYSIADIKNENIGTFTEKTRAILKIEDGCRNFCSYCLISFARGKIVSKTIEHIVSEASAVSSHGYREIVLTGIHLSSYGKDLGNVTLADAIEAVAEVDGIERIRLGSLEPTVITGEFVSRIVKIEKLCPAFHLSLQSGCDKTLRAMNRKYTSDEYEASVKLLRAAFPECAITTDMIVGFPQESDSDFQASCEFADKIGFAKIHIFPFSARHGTKAAGMSGQISKQTKQAREKVLAEIEARHRIDYLKSFIGKTVSVLVEQCNDGICCGFTDCYIKVSFNGSESMCNTFKKVTITGLNAEELTGNLNYL